MEIKKKKAIFKLSISACLLTISVFWLLLRPVEVIAVHKNDSHSYVLVKNFPFTDKGKINWWLKNKDVLADKYKIPSPASDGSFVIIFWDFGKGYKETDGYDNLCFSDMQPPLNCIEKDALLMVRYSKNTGNYFVLATETYRINNDGRIIQIKSD
ncbi:DUF943 family protein [[Erwinia] mediterraneensis]|uniref:DUF943 family protein n=1 Tax=[Erwinia] mediterraneensis TaxID=2161819 RepID=UPI00102F65F8|nr:DUF943 family protein [[Erwinia] mediterraneensis]